MNQLKFRWATSNTNYKEGKLLSFKIDHYEVDSNILQELKTIQSGACSLSLRQTTIYERFNSDPTTI